MPEGDNQPKTYTEAEFVVALEKSRNDIMAEVEGKYKPFQEENQTLKSQIESTAAEIDKMKKQIDELAQADPDKLRLVNKLRDLESKEQSLKADKTSLEKEKQSHAEVLKKVEQLEIEKRVTSIAQDYEDVDLNRFGNLVKMLTDKSEANIRAVADAIWQKKGTHQPDSGRNYGGGGLFTRQDLGNYDPTGKTVREMLKDREKILDQLTKRR